MIAWKQTQSAQCSLCEPEALVGRIQGLLEDNSLEHPTDPRHCQNCGWWRVLVHTNCHDRLLHACAWNKETGSDYVEGTRKRCDPGTHSNKLEWSCLMHMQRPATLVQSLQRGVTAEITDQQLGLEYVAAPGSCLCVRLS